MQCEDWTRGFLKAEFTVATPVIRTKDTSILLPRGWREGIIMKIELFPVVALYGAKLSLRNNLASALPSDSKGRVRRVQTMLSFMGCVNKRGAAGLEQSSPYIATSALIQRQITSKVHQKLHQGAKIISPYINFYSKCCKHTNAESLGPRQ